MIFDNLVKSGYSRGCLTAFAVEHFTSTVNQDVLWTKKKVRQSPTSLKH